MKPMFARGSLCANKISAPLDSSVLIRMSNRKPVILLVDDDPAMQRLLAKWLEQDGYEVRRADNGRTAMAAILAECPDIVLTDWEMPEVDGMELCRWMRRTELPHYVYT